MGFSVGLKDLIPTKSRDPIIKHYQALADKIHSDKALKTDEKEKKLVGIWSEATSKIDEAMQKELTLSGNHFADMVYSGSKGKKDQLRQMVAAPMLMQDSTNRIIPTPVLRSYAEGLDVGDYWLSQHGARKGTLQRAIGTEQPGAISKDIMNTTMATLVTSPDCGTKQGILMSVVPKEDDLTWKDIYDRHLAAPYKTKDGTHLKEGTLITPEVLSRLKNSKIDKVLVRSPLKCEEGDGICAKCFGLNEHGHHHDIGTNIGVLAGQAMGEPAVQMAMDAFHSGGVASSERGARSVDRFERLKNLLKMPKTLRDAATLSTASGTVSAIKKDPNDTGQYVVVNGVSHFVPKLLIKDDLLVGKEVKKGDTLSEGFVDPKKYLAITKDIHAVQNHLVKEMHEGLYDKEGVRRRNIEVVVRALTNLTKVKDPGTSDFLPGDVVPRSVVESFNRALPKGQKHIEHEPELHGVGQIPAKASNWMARLNYQGLHSAIQQAAAQAQKADLHGTNPIPSIAFGSEFGKPPPGRPKYVY
jgi:DNA-directed RNA polymerase subunit beta'